MPESYSMFSSRVPADLLPNRLAAALERCRQENRSVTDLTESNPTRVGLHYPPHLLDALASPAGLLYEPHALGLPSARQAVADDFTRRGHVVDAAHIALTASTSEAYSLLFKLLCDPGDEVLVPTPSYPLFEHLTRLDGVVARPYPLEYHGAWSIDAPTLAREVTSKTRAVLVVNPNNPTGSYLDRPELEAVCAICRDHSLALIGDEVFAEYLVDAEVSRVCSVLDQREVLTFALGGLSKSSGLPQMKLGWIAVSGPRALAEAALARLEVVCDMYLSVGTPVQQAAPTLLHESAAVRGQIRDRVRENYRRLLDMVVRHPTCDVLEVEGGWYAVIQVPAIQSEEALVVRLVEDDHILVHPGYFFDFPREAYLVVSLLPAPETFARAVSIVLRRVD